MVEPNPTLKPVVYDVPGTSAVTVRRELPYADARAMDIYAPEGVGPRPAVILVTGFPDPGMEAYLGKKLKDWASYEGWARLIAASGAVAVTYANREPEDLFELLAHLRAHAAELGIDDRRLGIWSCSGNVPMALALLMREPETFRCAALLYGLMLDLDGHTAVADFWARFGRTSPAAGRTVNDLPGGVPLLVARAGRDQTPGLNPTLDRFVAAAVTRDLPLTLINHAGAPHAFDLDDDSDASRRVIRQILGFLELHL